MEPIPAAPDLAAADPFRDLEGFVTVPRLASLALSPDGRRLVTVVSRLTPDRKAWHAALWEIDPAGRRAPGQLTRSAKSETSPAFLPDGGLLFSSERVDPEADPTRPDPDGEPSAALWLLPPTGEARQLHRPAGGISALRVAREAGTVIFGSPVLTGVVPGPDDEARRRARADAGVTAILHETYPVRYWDHDLGPDRTRLFASAGAALSQDRLVDPVDLTPDGQDRVGTDLAVSPDGREVVYVHAADVSATHGRRDTLRRVATDGSGDRVLVDVDGYEFAEPVFTPDGSAVVCVRHSESTVDEPPDSTLVRIGLADGEIVELTPGFEHWPAGPVVAPDGRSVYFSADCGGRRPVWRLDRDNGTLRRLTAEGSYTDLCVGPDGSAVYALRAAPDHPAEPVRIDPDVEGQDPMRLPAPGIVHTLPGVLTEISASAADGCPLRAWLVLPEGVSEQAPAPLLLWVHGGPLMSWNSWSWRWNPWLAAARGYAVLLPDPALSAGYGQDFVRRGWGSWGGAPFTDLMAATDAAVARPDIDGRRTAALGGSFGGYMANWIATQTQRFAAIVTHASLWHLDAFTGTTDSGYYWIREMGDPRTDVSRMSVNSPHLRVAQIRTPMLVIHGDRDYRVPIGEGLRLYFDLVRHEVPARFLYFPTENHWVLTPGNARVWYETVFAFLAEQVLGQPWTRPELL